MHNPPTIYGEAFKAGDPISPLCNAPDMFDRGEAVTVHSPALAWAILGGIVASVLAFAVYFFS